MRVHLSRSWIAVSVAIAVMFAIAGVSAITYSSSARRGGAERARLEAGGSAKPARAADPAQKSRVSGAYGKLPIGFEANMGQTDARVRFSGRGRGYRVFLTGDEAVISLRSTSPRPRVKRGGAALPGESAVDAASAKTAAVHLKLVGANAEAEVAGVEKLPGVSNYYIGNDPTQWRTNVPTYAEVRYRSVYPGIDLKYYGNEGSLEHDFVVTPGADPNSIAMQVEGADRVGLTAAGDLSVKTEAGELSLMNPTVYQTIGGERRTVAARYVLASNNEVRFEIGDYDHTESLIIDPVLKYSTLLGSCDEGSINKAWIAVNNAGEAYVGGVTSCQDFPTKDPIDTEASRPTTAFVTKMNAAGSALIFSTYIGGSKPAHPGLTGYSAGAGIAIDSEGAAYLTGQTDARDFPVKNAYQTSYGGGWSDAFVTKLSSTGALLYSTYLGGSATDSAWAIAVDGSGHAYVTGNTEGSFPTTGNPFKATSTWGIFVTELNASGNGLVYSALLGGAHDSLGTGIAVDSIGNAYVTGQTTVIPVVNAFQPYPRDTVNAFVSKISPSGGGLVYSSYLGGGNYGAAIAVDSAGEAYIGGAVVGATTPDGAASLPTTWNAFMKTAGGFVDGFVTKLSASGKLLYSTYIGGSDWDVVWGLAVDQYRTVYIAGFTKSVNFPLSSSLGIVAPGGETGFVATLVPSGELGKSIHYYSTTLGGPVGPNDQFEVGGIAVDSALNAYVSGETSFRGFPTTPGAFERTFRGSNVSFVSKLVIAADMQLAIEASPRTAVHGSTLTYTLTTRNNGPDWAAYLKLSEPLPAGTTLVSYDAGGGTCTAPAAGGTGTLSCTLPRLDNFGAWTVQLVVKVNAAAGSKLVNNGHIRSNMQDLIWENNYGELTTPVH